MAELQPWEGAEAEPHDGSQGHSQQPWQIVWKSLKPLAPAKKLQSQAAKPWTSRSSTTHGCLEVTSSTGHVQTGGDAGHSGCAALENDSSSSDFNLTCNHGTLGFAAVFGDNVSCSNQVCTEGGFNGNGLIAEAARSR